MAIPNTASRTERALFWLACRLAWLVARAANRLDRPGVTFVDIALAKAALEFVSAVGWVVDRLPLGDAPYRHHSPKTVRVHPPFDVTRSNGHIQSTH
jgi:hypothetical protein